MATTTVFSGTGDGRIVAQSATSYAAAKAGETLSASTITTSDLVGQNVTGGVLFALYQLFLGFDTSAIPDSDTITGDPVLSVVGFSDFSTTDFVVEARVFDWSSGGLTTGDWQASPSGTKVATFNTSGWVVSGGVYNDFTAEAAFAGQVDKTGTTYLMLCSKEQVDNSAPTTAEYVGVLLADQTGTTEDPKLVVTHAAAAAGRSSIPAVIG